MNWLEKAEWLRTNGYALEIIALDEMFGDGNNKWMASVEGEWRCYSATIADAVEQVYEFATQKRENAKRENVKMLYVNGSKTAFRCHCGANVFRSVPPQELNGETRTVYECNGCGDWYSEAE